MDVAGGGAGDGGLQIKQEGRGLALSLAAVIRWMRRKRGVELSLR